MHWVRKPRLNNAVATVAVLMVFSLLRVASVSFVMVFLYPTACHSPMCNCTSWMRPLRRPGIHTHDRGYGFRAQGFALPRNDGANRSTAHQPAHQNRFPKSQ